MKYVLSAFLLLSSFTFAQSDQNHEVNVRVPEVLLIRLTNGDNPAAVTNPTAVEFDLVAEQNRFETNTPLSPTNIANWDDVRIMSNHAGPWQVDVDVSDNSFSWNKVSVAPAGGLATPFTLTDGEVISFGLTKTGGWQSLGFGPDNFSITFDGSENAGSYSTTVSYKIYKL